MLYKSFSNIVFSSVLLAFALILNGASASAQEPQRMLILATPNAIEIMPYGSVTVEARCLDEDRDTPQSEFFYGTGLGLSSIVVSKGERPEIDLRRSIELGQVSVRGNGNTRSLEIYNNSSTTILISAPLSSVVVPESFAQTSDLEQFPYVLSANEEIDQRRLWKVKEWTDGGHLIDRSEFEKLDEQFDIIQDWLTVRDPSGQRNEWAVQPFVDNGRHFFALHSSDGLQRIFDIDSFGLLIESIQFANEYSSKTPTIHIIGDMDQISLDATALSFAYGNSSFLIGRDFGFEPVGQDETPAGLTTNSFDNNGIEIGSGGGDGGDQRPVSFEDDGWISRTLNLINRGMAKLSVNSHSIESWQPVLAGMETGVMQAKQDQNFSTLTAEAAASLIEDRVNDNLELVKARMGQPNFDDDTVRSEIRVDDALFNRFYVELRINNTKFATLTFD